jgi:rubrerythrin
MMMDFNFDKAYGPYEAVMLGVDLEEAGRNFYNRVANSCGNFTVKDVFRQLAEAEVQHKKVIVDEIETQYAPSWYREEDKRMMLEYIHSVRKQPIFPDPNDAPACEKAASDAKGALDLGIRAEKQSIEYYEFLRNATQDAKGKEVFEKLRLEEVKHLEKLENLKKEL